MQEQSVEEFKVVPWDAIQVIQAVLLEQVAHEGWQVSQSRVEF